MNEVIDAEAIRIKPGDIILIVPGEPITQNQHRELHDHLSELGVYGVVLPPRSKVVTQSSPKRNLRCLFGHSWGKWGYAIDWANGVYNATRYCTRCGKGHCR